MPLAAALLAAGCRGNSPAAPPSGSPSISSSPAATESQTTAPADTETESFDEPVVVVAPSVRNVDEALIRQAFRQVLEKGLADYAVRPQRTIIIYVDPDSATGLEDALGLSQKNAIHLRAGRTRTMSSLLPLLMHEYTHSLQYQAGRLRPQWWIEGQADYQALRIQEPGSAGRQRRMLYQDLARDVRAGRAVNLADLRSGSDWDSYVKSKGPTKAYGWGNAATQFIEAKGGLDAVRRVMLDKDGPNTLSRFDVIVQEVTGLGPDEFDAALKQWVVEQAGNG